MGEGELPKPQYTDQAIIDLIGKDVLKKNAEANLTAKREQVAALYNGIKQIEISPFELVKDLNGEIPKAEFLEKIQERLNKELEELENLKKRVGELA